MQSTLAGLLQAEEYVVKLSSNGEEALKLLSQGPVDLILCDVMMPRMDGVSFYQIVRESRNYYDIPFIFLTALDSQDQVDSGKECGAEDYITKPFEPSELLATIKGKIIRSNVLRQQKKIREDEFKRRVLQTLSHEFRTPLVAISTGTDLVLEQLQCMPLDKIGSLLEAVKRGGVRLEGLVNDFMLVQQIESGVAAQMTNLQSRPTSIGDFVAALREKIEDNQKVVDRLATANILNEQLLINKNQVVEAVKRLVDNAIKFGVNATLGCYVSHDATILSKAAYEVVGDSNKLDIIHSNKGLFVFTIKDKGEGFDLNRLGEAMELFGQLDRGRFEQQGGGLGLSISSSLIRLNGGQLRFHNVATSQVVDAIENYSVLEIERKSPTGESGLYIEVMFNLL